MYDNKIRLSQDVLEKAELIAQEWGLKNARAAVEAVFRKYADEYRNRQPSVEHPAVLVTSSKIKTPPNLQTPINEVLSELDELLGL